MTGALLLVGVFCPQPDAAPSDVDDQKDTCDDDQDPI
jgi:hypothetical protein